MTSPDHYIEIFRCFRFLCRLEENPTRQKPTVSTNGRAGLISLAMFEVVAFIGSNGGSLSRAANGGVLRRAAKGDASGCTLPK